MAELVPIIESGDLKNVVLQNDLQMLAAAAAAFEGMHIEIGPSGWFILNRKIDNDLIDSDSNAANVALTANVESAAICTTTITEDIADGFGTYLLTFLFTGNTSPSTVTVRVYVDGGLQTSFVANLELNTPTRTLTYSGTINGAATAGQVVTFTVEASIAGTVSGATYASVLRVTNVRELDHTRWRGIWVQGQTYNKNDMVTQNGWLGVVTAANTTDGPEPVATGVEDWIIDLNGTWAPVQSTISEEAYWTGNVYQFAAGLYVLGYRIWLPDNSQNFQFQVWAALNLNTPNERIVQIASVPNGVATGQWVEVGTGTLVVAPGTTLHMLKLTLAATLSETFSANWDVKNTNGSPGEGEANFQSNETEIRVHKTDDDGIDQTANLEAVEVGGTLSFGGSTWTITEVDIRGSHVRYHIEPAQGRPSENTYSLTFSWGSVEDIPFVTDADYWSPVGPIRGCQGTSIRNLDLDDDAHGVDVYVQQVVVSDDWDIMSAPGTG